MNNNEVELIIRNEINKDVKIIKRFSGGMSNYTYLIEVDKILYTYRIPGKNSEVFINREIEKTNIELIENLNLNCDNVYINTNNGHKMAKYIDGDDLSNNEVDYDTIAAKLRTLHNSGIKAANDYIKKDKLCYYESLINRTHSNEYVELKNTLFSLLDVYDNVEMVFCHGDSQKSNWIQSDDLYLLDWEYSGNNDPFYDIACFGNVDFNDALTLLKHYLQRTPTQEETNRLTINRAFQCMQWHNIAIYKDEIGLSKDLNMDFIKISEKYIILAKNFISNVKL